MPDFAMTYKGHKISYYANTGVWSITKTVPGKHFDKIEYVARKYSRQSCIEFIDSL